MPEQARLSPKTLLWLAGAGAIALISVQPGWAQQATDLPPPPAASGPAPTDSARSSPASEQVFQAPSSLQPVPAQGYAVVVNGDSPYLLGLVQQVAPEASLQQYQGQQVIRISGFESEAAAQQQVAALNQQGIRSQIISSNAANADRYWVIVPGDQADLAKLTEQAVRLGVRPEAIQTRDRPLGTHLAIGAFADRGEAEAVSRTLRGGGLDARVFFR